MNTSSFSSSLKSLQLRILAVSYVITICVSILLGYLGYYHSVQLTLSTATEGFITDAELLALNVQKSYDEIENDARVISLTPPIQGIIRSIANNHIDPDDPSTTALWLDRLSVIFSSVMSEKPIYTQIRYISLANHGQELVRVDRIADNLIVKADKELQEKGDEPYVKKVAQGTDTFFFTSVTLNREHGKITKELVPTLRAVLPIKASDGTIFGLIVININYESFSKALFKKLNTNKQVYLINQSEDYVQYLPESNLTQFKFHKLRQNTLPDFLRKAVNLDKKKYYEKDSKFVTTYVKLNTHSFSDDDFTVVVFRVTLDQLFAGAYKAKLQTILLALILIILLPLIVVLVVRNSTTPAMREMQEIHKRLRDKNFELQQFSYRIAHDIKHPLINLGHLTQFVTQDSEKNGYYEVIPQLDEIYALIQSMVRLVDDINQVLQADYYKGNTTTFNILDYRAHFLNLYQADVEKVGVDITIEDEVKEKVFCDVNRLNLVLDNLLSNAIKYHDPIKSHKSIVINLKKDDKNLYLTITDNGIGIPKNEVERVLDIFYRAKNATATVSSGLGLYLVKSHIEHMNGNIIIESQEKAWTKILLTIPLSFSP